MPTNPLDFQFQYEDGTLQANWDASLLPAGAALQLRFLDQSGSPLSQQPTLNFTSASAVVSGPAVVVGAQFWVQFQVPSHWPWSATQAVTIANIQAPTALTADWRQGAVHATWTDPVGAGPFAFEGRLVDSNKQPFAVQPDFKTEGVSGFSIDGSQLQDGLSYVVAVRAISNGSRGAWAYSDASTVDKSTPDSTALRGLRKRLRDAIATGNGTFALTPTILDEPSVSKLFPSLLGLPNESIQLSAARLTSTSLNLTLEATAVFGFVTAPSTFTFSAPAEQLRLVLASSSLGPQTVQQLVAAGVVPESPYPTATWAANLGALPALTLLLDSASGTVTFAGSPTTVPWSIPVGLANVSFGSVSPNLQIDASTGTELMQFRPSVNTDLLLGTIRIPVQLTLPHGSQGWQLKLAAPTGLVIGDLANINPLMGGARSGLPLEVINIGGFKLNALAMDFAPINASVWHVHAGFSVGPTGNAKWSTANGLVEVSEVSASLDLTLFEANGLQVLAKGAITGRLQLTQSVEVKVCVLLPPGSDGLLLNGNVHADNFSLTSLSAYMGGDVTPLTDFLDRMGSIGSLGLRDVSLLVSRDASSPALRRLSMCLEVSNWTIASLSPWFAVQNVALFLEVDQPGTSSRSVSGHLTAEFLLGEYALNTSFDFTQQDQWTLYLDASAAELPDLSALDAVIPSATITGALPSEVNGTDGWGLDGLTLVYDTVGQYLESGSLQLRCNDVWSWFSGQLQLWNIDIDLAFSRTGAAASLVLEGSISGIIEVAGTEVLVSGSKSTGASEWRFSGELRNDLTIDFGAVLDQFVKGYRLPSGHGFPSEITLNKAVIAAEPSTGAMDFEATSTLEWSLPVGLATLKLTQLGGEVHLPTAGGAKSARVSAKFNIGKLVGDASIALGAGSNDVVVQCAIATGNNPSPTDFADALVGQGTYASVPTPTTFFGPRAFANAALTIDAGLDIQLLTGQYIADTKQPAARYGSLALLVKQNPAVPGTRGFMLAASLDQWRLDDISPALTGVDSAIGLNIAKACVVLSTLDESPDPSMSSRVSALPAGNSVKPGLNLFVELDFTANLLNNISEIASVQGPYTLRAQIPSDPATTVEFEASLGKLTILNQLQFDKVRLHYAAMPGKPTTRSVRLNGDISASLDQQSYQFHGDLVVTDTAADFKFATRNSVVQPLGIPNLTLDELGLDIHVDYGTTGKRSASRMAFYGSVSLASSITLRGLVAFDNGHPKLVLVQLSRPDGTPAQLDISVLFNKLTGLTWPAVADLSLSRGQVSWLPGSQRLSWQNQVFDTGLHASVITKILFLPEVKLDVAIITDAMPPAKNGLSATARFTGPIDWDFIQFTGTGTQGSSLGPSATIDTRDVKTPFRIEAGVRLFGIDLGDVHIAVGKNSMTGSFDIALDGTPLARGANAANPAAGKTVAFTWANNKFRVDHWPLDDIALPKFELKDLKGSGGCSQIIMDALPIDTKFKLAASLEISPAANGKAATLDIQLNGTFELRTTSSAYQTSPLMTASVANATLQVPMPTSGGYDWADLARSLAQAIQGATQSIVDNLLLDPENLAKLSAVAGGKWALANAVDYLVCRGMTRAAANAAVSAATSAVVGVVNAVCAGGSAIAVGGAIARIHGGQVTNDDTQPIATQSVPTKPVVPVLTFDTDSLQIDWTGSPTANISLFGVSLRGSVTGDHPTSATANTNTKVPIADLQLGQTYSATIIGAGPGGRGPASDSGSCFLVGAPVLNPLALKDSTLEVTWSPDPHANGFELRVVDSNAAALLPTPTIKLAAGSATIQGSAIERGGVVQVQGRAIAPNCLGPWSLPVQIAILPAPIVKARSESTQLVLSWSDVPGATSYTVVIGDSSGQSLSPQPQIDYQSTSSGMQEATVSGAGISSGAQLIAFVRSDKAAAVGNAARVPVTLTFIVPPKNLDVVFDVAAQRLDASWDSVPNATGYALQVRDTQGHALVVQPVISVSGLTATVATDKLTANSDYLIAIRGTSSDSNGEWATSTCSLAILAAPGGVALVNSAMSSTVTWQVVPGSSNYEVSVLSGGLTLPLHPVIDMAGPSATIAAADLTAGQAYDIQVRATRPNATGPWSPPVRLLRQLLFVPTKVAPPGWVALGAIGQQLSYDPMITSFAGRVWVIATTSSSSTCTVRSTADGITWTQHPDAPFAMRTRAGCVTFAGKIWILGGELVFGGVANDVWTTTDGDSWTQVTGWSQWSARGGHSALIHQNKLWVMAGRDGNGRGLNDVWSSIDGVTWIQAQPSAAWSARVSASVAVLGSAMLMMGGTLYGNSLQDIWTSADGVNWSKLAAPPWRGRSSAAVVTYRGVLYLSGGINANTQELADMWSTTDGITWNQVDSAGPWGPRGQHAMAQLQNGFVLVGGSRIDMVWMYRP